MRKDIARCALSVGSVLSVLFLASAATAADMDEFKIKREAVFEFALFHVPYLATHTDRRLFIADPGNQRIASVKLGYHADEKVALKDVPDQVKR